MREGTEPFGSFCSSFVLLSCCVLSSFVLLKVKAAKNEFEILLTRASEIVLSAWTQHSPCRESRSIMMSGILKGEKGERGSGDLCALEDTWCEQ